MKPFNRRTEFSKDNWQTPHYLFEMLDNEFKFTLDPASDEFNHKTKKYYTKEINGLKKNWEGETVFVNPPFNEKDKWIEKGYIEGMKGNTVVVMIIPSTTDTKVWHEFVMKCDEIRFCKGRVQFELPSLLIKKIEEELKDLDNKLKKLIKDNYDIDEKDEIKKIKNFKQQDVITHEIKILKKTLRKNSPTFPLSIIVFRKKGIERPPFISSYKHKNYAKIFDKRKETKHLDNFFKKKKKKKKKK